MTNIIQTEGLNYFFGKQQTLHNLNLQVPSGSIYGFLGPNGAGKTTTLRLILGLLKNQQGKIEIFGKELSANRLSILRKVGSLIEQPSLYGHLTASENLNIYRKIYGVDKKRIKEVLQLVGLEYTLNKKAKQFSLGMKQRLSIAVALLHNPPLLILDEPTNGLDPNGIIETRELIRTLNREHGVTIIVSSHILAEIEKMATHVGIIHHGKLLSQGTLDDLNKLKKAQSILEVATSDNDLAFNILQKEYAVERTNGHLVLPFVNKEGAGVINKMLLKNNVDVYHLNAPQSNLEQLFIDITSN
jgi:ABC-2 type transport system ATP-binding protein